jgi:hypothetical protein
MEERAVTAELRDTLSRQSKWMKRTTLPVGPKSGNVIPGVFTPVLAKHSKSFSLIDCISAGVDRMQRNFEPMRRAGGASQRIELSEVTAKVVTYGPSSKGGSERLSICPAQCMILL